MFLEQAQKVAFDRTRHWSSGAKKVRRFADGAGAIREFFPDGLYESCRKEQEEREY